MAFVPEELNSRSSPSQEAAPSSSSATNGSCFLDRDMDPAPLSSTCLSFAQERGHARGKRSSRLSLRMSKLAKHF